MSLVSGTMPDLAAIKQRQQATWASGDVSELLIEALDLRPTERILDVATGSGNAALAAARRGCTVVGLDYVPALLERARLRAEAEGLEAEFIEGDAEALPFDDRRSSGARRNGCASFLATRSPRSVSRSGTTSSATARRRPTSSTGGYH